MDAGEIRQPGMSLPGKRGRGPGRPFKKGERGGPGRKAGAPNKVSLEVKEFSREFLMSDSYRNGLKRRVEAGQAPHMETLLNHYAFGKPREEIALSGKPTFQVLLLSDRDPLARDPDAEKPADESAKSDVVDEQPMSSA